MNFEPVGHSLLEHAMLTELLSASGALRLSHYKEFLSQCCHNENNLVLDQKLEEAIQRKSGNRIRGLMVRHADGQIMVSGQANSYQTRQLVIQLLKNAIEESALNEVSARIDISVNSDRPDVVYVGCPAATLVEMRANATSNESQPKMLGQCDQFATR